jgi:hypothetical protein
MLIADCRRLDAATNSRLIAPCVRARTRRGFYNMREPGADLDRYLALLRDADDEAKRLALIQLLIAEGARGKLAAKSAPVETKHTLPQQLPLELPASRELPPLRSEPLASSLNESSSNEEPQNGVHFDRGQAHLPLPGIGRSPDAAAAAALPPVLPAPSRADELVDKIAKLLSARPDFAKAAPAATLGSPPAGPSSGNDVENSIAALIRAELAKR